MSDPLNTTVFEDAKETTRVVSNGGIGPKQPSPVSTQLHTPLPRPHGGSSLPAADKEKEVLSRNSMEAINRSRSTTDPLANFPDVEREEDDEDEEDDVEDEISTLDACINDFLSKISSPPVNVDTISRNTSGLHKLASCNAWAQVIDLSHELLKVANLSPFRDDGSLSDIFVCRMKGLFRLKMLDELQQELMSVLAIEESKFLTHITGQENSIDTEQGGAGTFLSYCCPAADAFRVDNLVSLQLLFVEVKIVTGRGDEALQMLYLLKQWLSSTENENDKNVNVHENRLNMWKWKVSWSLTNALIRQRLWRQGIKEMISLLDEINQANKMASGSSGMKEKYCSAEIIILCRISRTLIQVGALRAAASYLDKAMDTKSTMSEYYISPLLDAYMNLTRGLLSFSNDEFYDSCDLFKSVLDCAINSRASFGFSKEKNILLKGVDGSTNASSEVTSSNLSILNHPCGGIVEIEENILPIAANNFAVCSLHLRKIKTAVSKIEELIQDDPTQHMIDPIIFNLCTMYDLSYGPNVSTDKKKTLQVIAEKYNIKDLHWRSFRLN